MSLSGSNPGRRRIRTTDPAAQGGLECAWVPLEQALDGGITAAQLEAEQIDYLICDLVAIRHRRLVGAEPNDVYRTVVTERGDESVVVESYVEDEFGNEFSLWRSDEGAGSPRSDGCGRRLAKPRREPR